jgi:hypothetical protein
MSASAKTENRVSRHHFGRPTRSTAEAGGKKCHFYKPLPTRFRRDGFDYRQVAREGDVAIYEQRWTGCEKPSVCYEVIRIRRHEGFQIDGRIIEPAETYPRSEDWGVYGFTHRRELVQRMDRRE